VQDRYPILQIARTPPTMTPTAPTTMAAMFVPNPLITPAALPAPLWCVAEAEVLVCEEEAVDVLEMVVAVTGIAVIVVGTLAGDVVVVVVLVVKEAPSPSSSPSQYMLDGSPLLVGQALVIQDAKLGSVQMHPESSLYHRQPVRSPISSPKLSDGTYPVHSDVLFERTWFIHP